MSETAYRPNYDKWKNHFKQMSQNKSQKSQYVLNKNSQVGRGVEIISPSQQVVEMARAKINKPRKKNKRNHSTTKPQKKRTKKTGAKNKKRKITVKSR